jgi:hypothetical protein
MRRKANVDCYVGEKYKDPEEHEDRCECTAEDYEWWVCMVIQRHSEYIADAYHFAATTISCGVAKIACLLDLSPYPRAYAVTRPKNIKGRLDSARYQATLASGV